MEKVMFEKEYPPAKEWDMELKIRSARGVVRLSVCSQVFEDYFKSLSNGKMESLGGNSYWSLPPTWRPVLQNTAAGWASVDQPIFVAGGGVNLTWLRAVGLGKGVTILYNYPMSARLLDATVNALETPLREFWESYLGEKEFVLRMKARSRERNGPA